MAAKKVSQEKEEVLKEIVEEAGKSATIMISSMKGIPSSQFQRIRKKLSEAKIKVVKKNIGIRAIEKIASKEENISELKKYMEEGSVFIFSKLSPFELASMLAENRISVKAKAGQIALDTIKIEAGPTDMPAGPMITELSNARIKVGVESGKIIIKEDSILVKKDDKINENIASVLAKLEILPFKVGLEPIAAYDCKEKKIYAGIRIDKEELVKNLKNAKMNSFNLAYNITYYTKEIIIIILQKIKMQEESLKNLISIEKTE